MEWLWFVLIAAAGTASWSLYRWQQGNGIVTRDLLHVRESVGRSYASGGVLFIEGDSSDCLNMLSQGQWAGELILTRLYVSRFPERVVSHSTRTVKEDMLDLRNRRIVIPARMPVAHDDFGEKAQTIRIGGDVREIQQWVADTTRKPGPSGNHALLTFESAVVARGHQFKRERAIKALGEAALIPLFVLGVVWACG